jgi:PAS domain S-box-containing protein
MLAPAFPDNELQRVEALCGLNVLDTPADERFDRITRLAQAYFKVPITLVTLVDAGRQWFKSNQGLGATETPRNISFCGHAILGDDVFYVPNTLLDQRFSDNPLVTGAPDIRFYAGAPLAAPDGSKVGTLCVIDRQPRTFSAADFAFLRDLAGLVEDELERDQKLARARKGADALAQLAALIVSSDDAIMSKTLDGIITGWNPAAERIFGYTESEALGQPMAMLIPPERAYEEPDILLRIGRGERIQHFETIRIRKDGIRIDVSAGISPIRDSSGKIIGISKIARDITERIRRDRELLESSQLVKSIVETVVDAILTIDDHGKVLSFNPAAERMFGYAEDDVIGQNVKMLMPEPYQSEHDGYLDRYAKTKQARIIGNGREVTARRKDGTIFPMELAVSEMKLGDKAMFTGVVRDISERKAHERMKSEFVSTVSHELRTPLTSIRGALGLVLGKFSSALPDKARQLLETASRNSVRLSLLINDILDLEKFESGQMELDLKPSDLVALVRQAITANEGYAHEHGVYLRLAQAPEVASVRLDGHRMAQVFANLLSNAIKYSPKGGEVEVSVVASDPFFRVSVRDHGRGIPQEFRSRMFQRFSQADSSDTREKGGTGLGLSITKAIVEQHGGHIDYVSVEGEGTDFFFDLPVWHEITEQTVAQDDRPCMLICEDNSDVAMVLSELLEHEGIASDRAATAAGAIELLRRKKYRALLLDLGLPDMDGRALIHQLRGNDTTRDLPIIVVSGRSRGDFELWNGQAQEVLDWLQKPVDRVRLVQALAQAQRKIKLPRVLHVEDDADVVEVIRAVLEDTVDYVYAGTLAQARQRLAQEHFDLVLLDLSLPDGSGAELISDIGIDTQVVMFSGQEPSNVLSQQVSAALTKATTSNERLLATIKNVLDRNGVDV